MEKYLKPERLELDPSKSEAADTWKHWKMTFNIFLKAVCETQQLTSMTHTLKLKLLIKLLSPAIFQHISDIHDYSSAMNVLEEIFVKPKNSVFCRHLLATRRQQMDESVDQYLQSFKRLAKDCDFQAEHDLILKEFMNSMVKYGLTLNKNKCLYSLTSIDLLGYTISKGSVKPEPDRHKGLMDLPVPENLSLRRVMGMFSHYSPWIPNFSEKLHPLTKVTHYPLTKEQTEAFQCLKQEIAKSSLVAIDSSLPFEIETDVSEHAIAASLTQNGRPVAFFSRTLTSAE